MLCLLLLRLCLKTSERIKTHILVGIPVLTLVNHGTCIGVGAIASEHGSNIEIVNLSRLLLLLRLNLWLERLLLTLLVRLETNSKAKIGVACLRLFRC